MHLDYHAQYYHYQVIARRVSLGNGKVFKLGNFQQLQLSWHYSQLGVGRGTVYLSHICSDFTRHVSDNQGFGTLTTLITCSILSNFCSRLKLLGSFI